MTDKSTILSQRSKAYDWAMRVLVKRHKDEFKEIYHRILKDEFNLLPAGNTTKELNKYL